VVATLRLFRRGEDIYLALPAVLKAVVLKRLSMYVLRAKVKLTDAGDELSLLGLIGADAQPLLTGAGVPAPAQVNGLATAGGIQAIRMYGETRYLLCGPAAELAALKRRWEAATVPGNEEDWALQKVLAGEPTVFAETSEHFVAQMLDLDRLGAIDFKKGCYTGQEVIARAHYRGGVKRHLARARCETTAVLKAGMEIHDVEQDAPVAEIVDARLDAQGIWQMLIVVQDDFRSTPLMIGTAPVALS
jgi:folate-binding protein YgfZ